MMVAFIAAGLWAADLGVEGPAILARRCAGCHGARNQTVGLNLATRETSLPRLAAVMKRVRTGQMPPNGALPAGEQEVLAQWVAAGAPWTAKNDGRYWAWQPLRKVSGSIDEVVRAKLAANGLTPSPEAERRTLIRRVTLDLTGLPPTPEEVRAFLEDKSPEAYAKVVDRLLASPHYGERWARHWLDVARFTESEGFERDVMREHAWPYRDYVIRSFNQDKPYLQFVREQIAGDLFGTREGLIATGFLVSGPTDAVGLTSAVPREREAVREDQLEEMVGTVAQTFLGLTVNCARCHDHKFDPIPQRDYYRLKAALADVWQPFQDPASIELWPDGRALDEVYAERVSGLRKRIETTEKRVARLHGVEPVRLEPKPMAQWKFDVDVRDQIGELHGQWSEKVEVAEGRLRAKGETSITTVPLARDVREKTMEVWFYAKGKQERGVNLMEVANRSGYRGAATDAIRLTGGPRQQWINASTASFRTQEVEGPTETTAAGQRTQMVATFAADGTIRLYRNGEPYGKAYRPDPEAGAAAELQTYLKGDGYVRFTMTPMLELDEARLYATALTPEQVAAAYREGAPSRLPDPMKVGEALEQLASLRKTMAKIPPPEKAFAAAPREPGVTHRLNRGDVNQKAEVVTPGGLSCLNGPELKDRRALAEWIGREDNALLARVIVNRVWAQHFGVGVVENPNDFGANGGAPSHEDLLDRLAGELIANGWRLKGLQRAIVLSATYRQASTYRKEAAAKDADNRLLWRYAPRRLEGEAVRDAMLAVSGKLNPQVGGPSFRPFAVTNPGGSYVKYEPRDSDESDLQRRSVYRMNVNTGGDPMLESLDCPVPSVKTPRRPRTVTPLQALSLMNNPLVTRLSKAFADRLRREEDTVDTRVARAYALALGREPSAEERFEAAALVRDEGLEALCWGLFNASEFVQLP